MRIEERSEGGGGLKREGEVESTKELWGERGGRRRK